MAGKFEMYPQQLCVSRMDTHGPGLLLAASLRTSMRMSKHAVQRVPRSGSYSRLRMRSNQLSASWSASTNGMPFRSAYLRRIRDRVRK